MFSMIFLIFLASCSICKATCTSKTTFVPLQVTYDPVFEQALNYYKQRDYYDCRNLFATNLFVQTTTAPLSKYFMINNEKCLNVQEDGSGNVDSLWFKVISSDPTFYSSRLRMKPQRVQVGALFTGAFNFSFMSHHLRHVRLAYNTALIYAQTRVNLSESAVENLGTVPGFLTMAQSFASPQRTHQKICSGGRGTTGLDDIQLKIIYDVLWDNGALSPYFLLGIPTGTGGKAYYLFEPLVGSKHVNVGLGTTFDYQFLDTRRWLLTLFGEFKWRYACAAHETRSFDLLSNGPWSRYMLVVQESDRFTPLFASNDLVFRARVVPRNNVNMLVALHAHKGAYNIEAGYGFNYRQQESVSLLSSTNISLIQKNIGIADLVGIAALDPQSASTATICQAVEAGINPMHSDAQFTPITLCDIDKASAEQPRTISNKLYFAFAYEIGAYCKHPAEFSCCVSYEQGNKSALSQFAIWLGGNVTF